MSHFPTILLVEDDPDLRDAMELMLIRAGYYVVATGDGLRAVGLAEEHEPAVAVVDLLLPGQSGFQVTLALKARHGDRVRVIVVSGSASRHHQDYAIASGAERFLAKPFLPGQLVEAVAALCPPLANAADSGIRRAVRIGS
jgi:DNA-binding response OmpR family regulator